MDTLPKRKVVKKNWQETQTLYWKGNPIKRNSQEYQDLLDKAYSEIYKNTKFKAALEASGKAVLTHNIGKTDPSKTVLTIREFCSRLTKLRDTGTLSDKPSNKKLL